MDSRRRTSTGEAARNKRGSAKVPPSPPSHAVLHEYALSALARRAVTRAGMIALLKRKIALWASRAVRGGRDADEIALEGERARTTVDAIVERLVEVGLINDVSFALARAGRLGRAGKSRRAIAAHLTSKGVDENTARTVVVVSPDDELRAAVVLARRKRIGPFRRESAALDAATRQKSLAALARAGFSYSTADRVLRMSLEEAESRLSGNAGLDA